jgi:hypothetical protein
MATVSTPSLRIRAGHPDFLDLPWEHPLVEWDHPRRLVLPKGISRHEVRFFGYDSGIYAIKQLPIASARHEYEVLRQLEDLEAPSVVPVGVVERPWVDPSDETSGAVITEYLQHAFSYRELLSGPGFGERRNQMLDAFALLLVEVHLLGCFWGDCSLSNVLYRYDADSISVTMVDGETAQILPELTRGQREDDLAIMIENVAGGMADIAASQHRDLEHADLALGEDIAERYQGLWREITHDEVIGPDERYRINERIARINELGFEVEDLQVSSEGGQLKIGVTVGGRRHHLNRLRDLTGIEAEEQQARQILTDLARYRAFRSDLPPDLAAVYWRAEAFEPILAAIRELPRRNTPDPVQAYCDFLHHRFVISSLAGRDIDSQEALADWVASGQPGYPID